MEEDVKKILEKHKGFKENFWISLMFLLVSDRKINSLEDFDEYLTEIEEKAIKPLKKEGLIK